MIIPMLWLKKLGWDLYQLDWNSLRAKPRLPFILLRAWHSEGTPYMLAEGPKGD